MGKTTAKKTVKLADIAEINPVREIFSGVTVESLLPIFYNVNKLVKPPVPLYRLDSSGHRYYYRYLPDGVSLQFFTSVTTMIKNTLPTSPQLIRWMAEKGIEEGQAEAIDRAHYGTFLHAECAELLIFGGYNLDNLSEKLQQFLTKNNVPLDRVSKWTNELKKDILAFAQFVIDYNVEPLSIEVILYHPEDGYAGAIDLVCELNLEEKGFFGEVYASGEKKGQPKESKRTVRVRAIVDLKSGRKGFYESHEIQLEAYRVMWNIHYPELPIDRVFNFSPKEWRTAPSYNFKDQSESKNLPKLKYLAELARIEDGKRDNKVVRISGVINLSERSLGTIEELTFEELINKKVEANEPTV